MGLRYELCIGLNKGHKTSKIRNVRYTGNKKVQNLRADRLKGVSIGPGRPTSASITMMKLSNPFTDIAELGHCTGAPSIFFWWVVLVGFQNHYKMVKIRALTSIYPCPE